MDGGFSFCGMEAGKLGIQYAPDMPSTYIYGETYSEHQEAFEGHDGSLHYGTTVKAKQFRLRCYFENSHVNEGILDRVLDFFYRGRTGRLVFAQRDWLWYSATVASVDTTQLRNHLNGFITINLVAHYPFGRCDFMSVDSYDSVADLTADESLLNKTGFILTSQMPQMNFTNITANKTFVLYNPGTEYADVAISFSGAGENGVKITNVTTGQEERFLAFTKASTTDAGKYVICDSLNGKTILTDGNGNSTMQRMYHDYGFIRLAPARDTKRNLNVSLSGNTVMSKAPSAPSIKDDSFCSVPNGTRSRP